MILSTRYAGNRELRVGEFGSSAIPLPGLGYLSAAGMSVTPQRVFGLTAVGAAISLVSELMAGLPLRAFRGSGPEREVADDTWQDKLLDDPYPNEINSFDWKSVVSSVIEGYGNAFVEKVIDGRGSKRQVVALIPLDQDYVLAKRNRDTRKREYHVWTPQGVQVYGPERIIHFKGWTYTSGVAACSPIELYRDPLGSQLAMEQFVGRYFQADARPGVTLMVNGVTDAEKAKEYAKAWKAGHEGVGNSWGVGVLPQGSTMETIPVSIADAQYVEGRRWGVEEIARAFKVPARLLDMTEQAETVAPIEKIVLEFLIFRFTPRLRRLERTLYADTDLFRGDLYPRFIIDEELLRTDIKTRSEADHKDVQSGVMLRDEIRRRRGLPPLPGGVGSMPLLTPVGAGPNPDPLPSPPGEPQEE